MSYMSGSRVLDDLTGMECLDESTRDRAVEQMGKTYEFRETVRRDGKFAWTVDDSPGQPLYHS